MANDKNLPEIQGSDLISSTWRRLLDRDRNISNLFSGDAFTEDQNPLIDKGRPNWRTDLRRLYVYEGDTEEGQPIFTDLLSLLKTEELPYTGDSAYIPEEVNNVKAVLDFILKRNLLNEITLPSESITFVGDGLDDTYTLDSPIGNKSSVMIFIDGVKQAPETYDLINEGSQIYFKQPPAYGETIEVLVAASLLQYDYSPVITTYTGDGSTTDFSLGFEALNKNTLSVNVDNKELQKSEFDLLPDLATVSLKEAPVEGSKIQLTYVGKTSLVSVSPNSIGTNELQNGSVTREKLSENITFSGNMLDNLSVSGTKLVSGSITNDKLVDGLINGDKISNEAVSLEKLAVGVREALLGANNVSTSNLAAQSVTLAKLADDVMEKLNSIEARLAALELKE